jgi:hypothetical protein
MGVVGELNENKMDFYGLLMGTRGIWQELDENKKIFMGYWWEQKDFDGNLMGTTWILWEQ